MFIWREGETNFICRNNRSQKNYFFQKLHLPQQCDVNKQSLVDVLHNQAVIQSTLP